MELPNPHNHDSRWCTLSKQKTKKTVITNEKLYEIKNEIHISDNIQLDIDQPNTSTSQKMGSSIIVAQILKEKLFFLKLPNMFK